MRYQFNPTVHASALRLDASRREAERERAVVDLQRVIPGRNLERAEVAVAEIEIRPRPYAGAGISRRLTGQHERSGHLPGVVGDLFSNGPFRIGVSVCTYSANPPNAL